MPAGLKRVSRRLATGEVKVYWYHRATATALKHDPNSVDGLLEVAKLDKKAATLDAVSEAARGSYAELWGRYRDSPEWRGLKPRTRSDYQAVRDWLAKAADKPVASLTAGGVFALRDKAAKQRGRRFANYVVQVLSLTLEWGRKRDLCANNPARDVDKIRKPTGETNANRAWTAAEVEAFTRAAPLQLLVPFALGLFAGMRQGDALIVTWRAFDGSAIRWIAGKNGESCMAPATGPLAAILELARANRGDAVQIAVTSTKTPWTASGFRASFFKLLRTLRAVGAVEAGCTFHGLRHTIATIARDGGESESRVAAGIGDRSPAMAAIYGRGSDRAAAQSAILEGIQKHFANVEWKTPTPSNGKRVKKRDGKTAGKVL